MLRSFRKDATVSAVVLTLILLTGTVRAQFTSPTTTLPSLPTLPMSDLPTGVTAGEGILSDGVIDPLEYHVGPGDVFQVRLWTTNIPATAVVSPEQVILVPRIGEFSTAGKTLAELKHEVMERATANFKGSKGNGEAPVSFTLLQPRRILVKVQGEVETPGVYTLTGGTRADIAIDIANKQVTQTALFADESMRREIDRRKREAERLRPFLGSTRENITSQRYITVRHSDGSTDRVDLLRFNGTREARFCPLLREGDVIYVPFKSQHLGMIGVYGAVQSPGDYEFVQGDSLYAMIRNVYGTLPHADLKRVELTRMSLTGDEFTTLQYDVEAIRDGRASDIPLMQGDRIFVRGDIDVRQLSVVTVKGEVRNPGVYPITRTDTKLSDIVKAAGGFTQHAFLPGGSITRQRQDVDNKVVTQEEDALRVTRLANLDVFDTANFRLQTSIREANVAVNMDRLFNKGEASQDVTLRDQDVISIPATPNTIYVWGYVGSVGYIPYRAGASLEEYIAAAGGYAEGAKKSKARVIKARTKQWLEADETEIEAGDEIYVPKVGDYPDDYTLRTIGAIAGIVGGLVYVILAVYNTQNR